jgi:hypothetical protein
MQSAAFAVRLLSGPAEAVRVALASCQAGARKEAYQDARRRAGIIREAVWIRPAPGGHVAVVYLEADGLAAAFTQPGPVRTLPSGNAASRQGGDGRHLRRPGSSRAR